MKMKTKTKVRIVGGLGIVITVVSLIAKAAYCLHMPLQQRTDSTILLALIIGFSFINSAALLELRARIEGLEKRR